MQCAIWQLTCIVEFLNFNISTFGKPLHFYQFLISRTVMLQFSFIQGDYDGSGQRSCKCNYVDFYK